MLLSFISSEVLSSNFLQFVSTSDRLTLGTPMVWFIGKILNYCTCVCTICTTYLASAQHKLSGDLGN